MRFWRLVLVILLTLVVKTTGISQRSKSDSLQVVLKKYERKNLPITFSDTLYRNLLIGIAKEYRFYDTDSMYVYTLRALNFSKKWKDKSGEFKGYNLLGDYYSDSGKGKKAISYYKKAYFIADSLQDKKHQVGLLSDLGTQYSYAGDFSKALTHYLIALEISNEENFLFNQSILNEGIATLYFTQKEYDEALRFYKEVERVNAKLGNEIYQAETWSNMAELYAEIGNFDQAILRINKSIEIFERHNITDWLAFAYGVKGLIYLNQSKYKWALYWYDQSALLYKNLDDPRSEIELLNGMAQAYLNLNDQEKSMFYAKRAYEMSGELNSLEGRRDGANVLYAIFKKNKNYLEALKYHEEYQRLSDSLFRDENKKTLNLLQTKLAYDQEKDAIIINNERTLAQQKTILWTSLLILVILLGTLIPLFLNRRRIIRLYRILKTKTNSLKERESELKETNQTKDRMFSIIGHDLRSPIGALRDVLGLVQEGEMSKEDFYSFVPKLKSDVDHILFTLNNLLSWGYAQAKGSTSKPYVLSLNKIVENNIKFLQELARSKGIKIIDELSKNTTAYADENQIDIVIRNLLSNAIKFTPDNGLIILGAEEKGHFLEVSIKDTGVGMSEKIQEKIFSHNSDVTTYGTNNEKGTGLGLSLCKEMVEKNHGEIWVKSQIKNGSTFYFTIPRALKAYRNAG